MYADGSPADITAKVELWCDGRVRRQVHTFNGHFTLQVGGGNQQATVFDASVGSEDVFGARTGGFGGRSDPGGFGQGGRFLGTGTRTHMDLTGCELRAEQTGFQSETIQLTFRRPLDNPEVGTLVLYRAGSIVGTTTSVTTMSAPKKARKGYKKALKEVKKKKADYQKAVASDPKYLRPQLAMMELESRRQSWDQVSQWSTKVIELNPYLMQAHYYRGVANLNMRQLEQAEESLTKVRASHKADDYPHAGYLLGLVLV